MSLNKLTTLRIKSKFISALRHPTGHIKRCLENTQGNTQSSVERSKLIKTRRSSLIKIISDDFYSAMK